MLTLSPARSTEANLIRTRLVGTTLAVAIGVGCASCSSNDQPLSEVMFPAVTEVTQLDCEHRLHGSVQIPASFQIVGDTVAVSSNPLEFTLVPQEMITNGSAAPTPLLWGKSGLLLRSNKAFTLTVGSIESPAYARWGNASEDPLTRSFAGGPCDSEDDWIAFPGGWWVSEPMCVDVELETSTDIFVFEVPVGADCGTTSA